jgi:epoxyqueuosine reductase
MGFPASDDVAEIRAFARALCVMSAAEYADTFRGSAIKRAKLWMLQRNACIALGNVGTAADLPVLEALCTHEHPLVREHAKWACERVGAMDRQ